MKCPNCGVKLRNIEELKISEKNNEYRCADCGALLRIDLIGRTMKMLPVWFVVVLLVVLLRDIDYLPILLIILAFVFTGLYANKIQLIKKPD